jgi:transposase-like protein
MTTMKNSDAEIERAEMLILSGNVTVAAACKELGIAPPTYYRRLRQVKEKQEHGTIVRDNVTITIEKLDESANKILETLKEMLKTGKGYDTEKHDAIDVIKTTVGLITGYRTALQKATFMIDARQQTINITPTDHQMEMLISAIVVPALVDAGINQEQIKKASVRMQELYEVEHGKWEMRK